MIHAFSLEMLATACGLLNIYLIVRESLWNWLFGIITVSLYVLIFYQVKLYADMSLQMVFFILQFYGLYQWLYGNKDRTANTIRNAPASTLTAAFFATICLFTIIAFLLQRFTDSTTVHIDAITTSLSLVAQWMMSKKWIEHWWVWTLANTISIAMYLNKSLYFTSGLYFIFIFLNIFGYYAWHQKTMTARLKHPFPILE